MSDVPALLEPVPHRRHWLEYVATGAARLKELVFRICYCSVFDECFLTDFNALHPARVDKCPVPAVPYED